MRSPSELLALAHGAKAAEKLVAEAWIVASRAAVSEVALSASFVAAGRRYAVKTLHCEYASVAPACD